MTLNQKYIIYKIMSYSTIMISRIFIKDELSLQIGLGQAKIIETPHMHFSCKINLELV